GRAISVDFMSGQYFDGIAYLKQHLQISELNTGRTWSLGFSDIVVSDEEGLHPLRNEEKDCIHLVSGLDSGGSNIGGSRVRIRSVSLRPEWRNPPLLKTLCLVRWVESWHMAGFYN